MPEEVVARQFWIEEPGRSRIRTARLPPRGERQVLVRSRYSGVSRGTESLVFQGRVPESQHGIMRAPFQEGDFPGPVKYGYSSVGEVIEAPAEEADLLGREVFCLHPHQDLFCVPAGDVHPLPPALPPGRAILAANMETALNAVWDGGAAPGDRVVVVGGGVVGLLVSWLCGEVPGTEVRVVDVNASRRGVAKALGVAFSREIPAGEGADLVFHASGTAEGLGAALAAAGAEGTVVELSWFGDAPVELPLGEWFHSRRLTLRSSQVGAIRADRRPRWTRSRRLRLALDLLREPRLDRLVTGESPFEELPGVLERLSREPGDALCHRIRYPSAG